MVVGGQHHALAALPPENTRYPSYRTLVGPRGKSGRVRKTSPPKELDPGWGGCMAEGREGGNYK